MKMMKMYSEVLVPTGGDDNVDEHLNPVVVLHKLVDSEIAEHCKRKAGKDDNSRGRHGRRYGARRRKAPDRYSPST